MSEPENGHKVSTDWPSWRYGPNGEAQVFESASDVPKGWKDTQPKSAPLEDL
jgi:hypothetical protein